MPAPHLTVIEGGGEPGEVEQLPDPGQLTDAALDELICRPLVWISTRPGPEATRLILSLAYEVKRSRGRSA